MPRVSGVRPLGSPAKTILLWFSNSSGDTQPRALCRRRRLCQISRYSKIALASSRRVRQLCRLSSSTCMRDQNASIMELSKQSPTLPIDGTNPHALARSVKAHDPNCLGSTGGCNTGLVERL